MNNLIRSLILLTSFALSIDISYGYEKISEEAAVKIAEKFVVVNGYTAKPADKNKVAREDVERSYNIWNILDDRRNTLKAKAYGIINGKRDGTDGWTIVFKLTGGGAGRGRAVSMDLNGTDVRMEKVSVFLDMVDKKLDQKQVTKKAQEPEVQPVTKRNDTF